MKTFVAKEPFKVLSFYDKTVYYYVAFTHPYFYCIKITKRSDGSETALRIFPENMSKGLLKSFVKSIPKFLQDLAKNNVREEKYDYNLISLKLFVDSKGGIGKLDFVDVVKFLRDP
ncbi:MAG: hypothetical protein QW290_05050 [Sulfolobales archaeon]|uniref:Uncharacterized protein n=1 Tax=Ligamenvirales sp. TaxID=2832923 RepID=A0AAU6PX94_9VIRU